MAKTKKPERVMLIFVEPEVEDPTPIVLPHSVEASKFTPERGKMWMATVYYYLDTIRIKLSDTRFSGRLSDLRTAIQGAFDFSHSPTPSDLIQWDGFEPLVQKLDAAVQDLKGQMNLTAEDHEAITSFEALAFALTDLRDTWKPELETDRTTRFIFEFIGTRDDLDAIKVEVATAIQRIAAAAQGRIALQNDWTKDGDAWVRDGVSIPVHSTDPTEESSKEAATNPQQANSGG